MMNLILAIALASCPNNYDPDPLVVAELLEIERAEQIPTGLLVAAACSESGVRPYPESGDRGLAVGMFQFWPWAERYIDRLDWRQSARFYAQRVIKARRKAEGDCPGRGHYESREAYLWASAATTATRAPVRRGRRFVSRCARRWTRGESKHWALRRVWLDSIRVAGVSSPYDQSLRSMVRACR